MLNLLYSYNANSFHYQWASLWPILFLSVFSLTLQMMQYTGQKKKLPVKLQGDIFLILLNPNMTTKLPYHTPMSREKGIKLKNYVSNKK